MTRSHFVQYSALLIAFGLLVSALPTIAVSAQEDELPDPGITPDSWLYGLDKAIAAIRKALTFAPEGKARLALELASERLAEAKAMERIGKPELASNTIEDYESELGDAKRLVAEIADTEIKEGVRERILNTVDVHLAALNYTVPVNATYKAKRVAEDLGIEVAPTLGEKASRQLNSARNRVIEASALAEEGRPEILELANDYREQFGKAIVFGEQISELAEKKDFEKLVAEATSIHITILEDVLERIPEQAKPAIQVALSHSIIGRDRSLEELGKIDPANASRLYLRYAEERLAEAREKAEKGYIDRSLEITIDYRNMLNRSMTLIGEGQEVGIDMTEIAELISENATKHLEILQEVYELVPEEAKENIDTAMTSASKAQEKVSNILEKAKPISRSITLPFKME